MDLPEYNNELQMKGFKRRMLKAIGGKQNHQRICKHVEGRDSNIRKVYIPLR
jgi:hypothetical protein